MKRKYLAAPFAVFAALATQKLLERGGVPWLPGFLAGMLVLVVVLFLISGRRSAT